MARAKPGGEGRCDHPVAARPERAEGSGAGRPHYCPPRQPERNEPSFRLLEEEAAASREIIARDAVEEFKNSTLEYLQFFLERSKKGVCQLEEVRLRRARIR